MLSHPDFVRDIVVDTEAGLVITACRDEEVRVWDASSGRLECVLSGHFEEVTGLALVKSSDGERKVVSVSIDGTVRTWSLSREFISKTREEAEKAEGRVEEVEEKKEGVLTAEEEAELAELMDDDE